MLSIRLSAQKPRALTFIRGAASQSTKKQPKKPNFKPNDASSKLVEENDQVPLLQRPLGVREYPSTNVKTWADKRNELMDQDVRLEHRRHFERIKEASKGYFTDLNATRKHGGKTWVAPTVLIREDKSLYFPNVSGKALDSGETKHTSEICKDRISIIAMLSTKISEFHAEGFVEPSVKRYRAHSNFQYIQINLQENLLKSFLVSMFTSSLKASVPTHLHPNYLVSSQNMEYVRESLGMVNSRIGYVYLLDENLKIRWGGCADAKAEEAQALGTCTGVLLNRLDKKQRSPE